jgi:hypothetical protein
MTYRPVVICSDNIVNTFTDTKMINDIIRALNSKGLVATNFGLGPNKHNEVMESEDTPDNALVVNIFGGADAGMFYGMGSKWYKTITKPTRKMMIVLHPPSISIKNLTWLRRAWDDNYSPASFTGLANPMQYLNDNGYGVIESGDITVIANSIIAAADLGGSTMVQKQLTGGNLTLDVWRDMIKRYNAYVAKYGKRPGKIFTVNGGTDYITVQYYGVMAQNYGAYQKVYGQRPATIEVTLTKKTFSQTNTTVVTSDIQKKIIDGTDKKFTTFTEFYNLVKTYCDYAYYFDGQYNASNAVSMIIKDINGAASGLNCVDYTQVGVKLAKEMGYQAIPYGIWCSGDGINHAIFCIKGKEFSDWVWIDLAAAASSSKALGLHWCSGATTKEPSWIPYE